MTDLELALRGALDDAADLVPVSPTAIADHRRRMDRPDHRRRNLSLSIAGIAAATTGIVIGAVLLATGGSSSNPALANSAPVTLAPATPLSASQLQQSARILRDRLTELHVKGATITAAGGVLQASVPSSAVSLLTSTASTRGQLGFRQVLEWTSGSDLTYGKFPPPASPVTEARSLTPQLVGTFGEWDCVHHPHATSGTAPTRDYVIACDTSGQPLKYLLAPTAIAGSAVKNASASIDATDTWAVNVAFTGHGSSAWKRLTAMTYAVNGGRPSVGQTACSPPKGCNAISITLDGIVASAPYSEQPGGIVGGDTQISGSFTRASALQLAAVLNEPPLPTTFSQALNATTSTPPSPGRSG